MSCSSDSENDIKEESSYYIKYVVKGGAWYRSPFGHTSRPEHTDIYFMDKNNTIDKTSYNGDVSFSKVVGPVDKSFKPSLSAKGQNGGTYSASYEGTIEVLKDGIKLVGSNSAKGYGSISLTCDIND